MSFLPDNKAFAIYTAGVGVVLALIVALVCVLGPCATLDDDDSADAPMTPDELREWLEANVGDDDSAEGGGQTDDDSAESHTNADEGGGGQTATKEVTP